MTIRVAKGTAKPAFRLPKCCPVNPTSHGRHAPPRLESVNMNAPTRAAVVPHSRDNNEIMIGYTAENPSPATTALTTTPARPCDQIIPATPAHATTIPTLASLRSSILPKTQGASHLPSIIAP